jgi:hypothetical protein
VDTALDDAMDFLTKTEIELPAPEGIDEEAPTEVTPRSAETTMEKTIVRGPAALFMRETDPTIELTSLDDSTTDPDPEDLEDTTSKLDALYPPVRPVAADDGETKQWKGRRKRKTTEKGYRKR